MQFNFLLLFTVGAFSFSTSASEVLSCGKRAVEHQAQESTGRSTTEGDWPWNAAIYQSIYEMWEFRCAGTLIHSNIVLTAARCVVSIDNRIRAYNVEVHVGKYNFKENTGNNAQKLKVQEIVPHPMFNSSTNLENDIAIVRLKTNAFLNLYVQPVCLSELSGSSEVINKEGTVIGWRLIQTTSTKQTDNLQQTLMPVIPVLICRRTNVDFFAKFRSDKIFCGGARDGIITVCNGTIGGSMTFEENGVYSIRGIVSGSVPKGGNFSICDPTEYVVFTDVAQFIPWIKNEVPELNHSNVSEPTTTTTTTSTTTTSRPPETSTTSRSTTSTIAPVACRRNEEFAVDAYRCDETCEKYGDPICRDLSPEGRCYCKDSFIRLKSIGICVDVNNRACLAKMPPTNETCDRRKNEHLKEWLHEEPCANTCESYKVPCNISAPDLFWAPHCVCKDGFSRLPNGKCVEVEDPQCKELWNPTPDPTTTSTTTTTIRPTTTATTIRPTPHGKKCAPDYNRLGALEGHCRRDKKDTTIAQCTKCCKTK